MEAIQQPVVNNEEATPVVADPALSAEATVSEVQPSEAIEPPKTADQEALLFLQQNLPAYVQKILGYQGSKRQLQQVMAALAETPFRQDHSFSYPEAKELFDFGNGINSAKLILLHSAMVEQKIAEEIKARASAQTETEVNKETVNAN